MDVALGLTQCLQFLGKAVAMPPAPVHEVAMVPPPGQVAGLAVLNRTLLCLTWGPLRNHPMPSLFCCITLICLHRLSALCLRTGRRFFTAWKGALT